MFTESSFKEDCSCDMYD